MRNPTAFQTESVRNPFAFRLPRARLLHATPRYANQLNCSAFASHETHGELGAAPTLTTRGQRCSFAAHAMAFGGVQ